MTRRTGARFGGRALVRRDRRPGGRPARFGFGPGEDGASHQIPRGAATTVLIIGGLDPR
jgi:hypothetical protein